MITLRPIRGENGRVGAILAAVFAAAFAAYAYIWTSRVYGWQFWKWPWGEWLWRRCPVPAPRRVAIMQAWCDSPQSTY